MLNKSDSLKQLGSALAKAQGEFSPIPKNIAVEVTTRNGGKYTFHYADYTMITSTVRPILVKFGLSYSHQMKATESGNLILVTTLLHESGEWMASEYPIKIKAEEKDSAQAQGSAITYARRYSPSALLGLSTEDDNDGNGAEGNSVKSTQIKSPPEKTSKVEYMVYPLMGHGVSYSLLKSAANALAKMLKDEKNDQDKYDLYQKNDQLIDALMKAGKEETVKALYAAAGGIV